MRGYTHFRAGAGIIFTSRGDIHPQGGVRAAALYYPSKAGDRTYKGTRYTKKVDESGEVYVSKRLPSYLQREGKDQYLVVPEEDIQEIFDPFKVLSIVEERVFKTPWKQLIESIKKVVPPRDIGVIGSHLMGFATPVSDMDILIRGKENLYQIQERFNEILGELKAEKTLDERRLRLSIEKYHQIYNSENNDFLEMIRRRWSTIRTREYMTKLRFAYHEKEIPEKEKREDIRETTLYGKVIDAEGTNFMPREFSIDSEGERYTVKTYFWDFSYCVKEGDSVRVKATLQEGNTLHLCDKRDHGIIFI